LSAKNTYVTITKEPLYDLPGVASLRKGPGKRCA
jgi:hypothetical protein